jgi:predicted AlkP superfamily phosphohydrolase/phosphomutase
VDPADLHALREEIERALLALRDPWSGRPVVRALHARQDLYRGPHLDRAPDFALELELDDGYSYNLMPSASAPEAGMVFRRLAPGEYLGRKGRSLPGSHRRHGLYLAAGPRVTRRGEIEAHIADASATVLARMDVALPAGAPGAVLPLGQTLGTDGVALPESSPAARDAKDAAAGAAHDEARVAARLRNLGYIE